MVRLRPSNNRVKGLIFQALIGRARTTSEISYHVQEPLGVVRTQLIRMHHLLLVEPIGVRYDDQCGMRPPPRALSYFDDLLWDMTYHARNHGETVEGCRGCDLRELIPAIAEAGLVE